MKAYDLIVVGGSFSGLSCATAAANQGLRTLVVDKKRSAESYTQSTGIFVKEIADTLRLPRKLTRQIDGIRLYAPNLNYIDLHSPSYHFVATLTQSVLAWMARQAQVAGVRLNFNCKVGNLQQHADGVSILEPELRCRYLVGADGAKSTIARQFNLGRNHHYLLGVENEVVWHDGIDPNFLHVFLDPILAPGYIGWIVPGVNVLQVGLATRYPNKPALKHFMRKLGAHFGIDWQVISHRGGLIPCGGVVSPLAKGRVCLLGDAAGMVSPLTAGGIHPAIEIGEALGEAIADYLQSDGQPPHQQLRPQIPSYRVKRNLRYLFDTFTPPTFVYNHVIGHPFFKRIAQIIFFHHRGLFCKEAWRDILRGEHIP